ncbi:MAG TPA: hypothetical protein VF494_04100 [Candidatus Limnocylindrales bacterium]
MTNEPTTPPPSQPARPSPPPATRGELNDRMQAFGREAQAAGERLAADPNVISAGVWFGRLWGLVLIAIGLWFFAQVTLGMDLPAFDWNLAWPLFLIVIGGTILVSGLARRR